MPYIQKKKPTTPKSFHHYYQKTKVESTIMSHQCPEHPSPCSTLSTTTVCKVTVEQACGDKKQRDLHLDEETLGDSFRNTSTNSDVSSVKSNAVDDDDANDDERPYLLCPRIVKRLLVAFVLLLLVAAVVGLSFLTATIIYNYERTGSFTLPKGRSIRRRGAGGAPVADPVSFQPTFAPT